jgi:hypothetical protein
VGISNLGSKMKNLIIVLALFLAFSIPVSSYAQTLTQEEINAQVQSVINSLLAQVMELVKQVAALQVKEAQQAQAQQQVPISNPIISTVEIKLGGTNATTSIQISDLDEKARAYIYEMGERIQSRCVGQVNMQDRATNPVKDRACILSGY